MIIFALLSLSCTSSSDKSNDSQAQVDSGENANIQNLPVESLELQLAFEVPQRPWDLAVDPEGFIYASTQAGDKLYRWNPISQEREEMVGDFQDILAIAFQENTLYLTTSDNGVTGSLSMMGDEGVVVISEQADDGLLMRWPVDIIEIPAQGWLIADPNAGQIFWVAPSGSTSYFHGGSNAPESIAFDSDVLYIGGEDGIWSKSWPAGEPQNIDSRVAYGLEAYNGTLWGSNGSEKLFMVGDSAFGTDQIARPGSLLQDNQQFYIADRVGEGIWIADL